MDDRIARLETAVAALQQEVAELRSRVDGAAAGRTADENPADQAILPNPFVPGTFQHWLSLTGRTLVILGGAYLLRALTEARFVPAPTGVALGLAYGAPWLLLASRARTRGAQADAFSYGLATALIGFPLVWEATFRFDVLSPPQSAALLGVLTAGAFILSAATRLQSLAWIVMLGALASGFSLAIATAAWPVYTLLVIAVGISTLWLGYLRGWTVLCWPAAGVANLMLFIVTGRAASSGGGRTAVALQALLLLGYGASFAAATLARRRRVAAFEIAQSLGALIVAFGGFVFLMNAAGFSMAAGVIALVSGAVAYVVATAMARRHHDTLNVAFYSMVGMILAMSGAVLALGSRPASVAFAVCAVMTAVLTRPAPCLLLKLQSAIYASAASIASGLLTASIGAIALPQDLWPRFDASMATAWIAVVAAAVVHVRHRQELTRLVLTIPRTLLLWLVTVLAVGGTVIAFAALAGTGRLDNAVLSTARTTALVLATLCAARARQSVWALEAGWLTYPLLVATGLKILFVDFPQGRPATLFVALAMYGTALIVAARGKPRPQAAVAIQRPVG